MTRLRNAEKRFLAGLLFEYATELRDDGFTDEDSCVSTTEELAVRLLRSQRVEAAPGLTRGSER